MLSKFAPFATGLLALVVLSALGCTPPETKLTKQEEQNFKGSSEMSEEAKKRMAEGMKRMAEIQKNNGKMPAGTTGSGGS